MAYNEINSIITQGHKGLFDENKTIEKKYYFYIIFNKSLMGSTIFGGVRELKEIIF